MRFRSAISLTSLLLSLAITSPAHAQATGAVTGTSLNVSTVATGTVLQVTPAATPDRRYVGMSITAQSSTLTGIDTFVLDRLLGNASGRPAPAIAVTRVPFRPAVTANVTIVDHDKPLLATTLQPMEIRAASLKAAVRRLADATKKNLVLGDRGLTQAGIDINAPHNFFLKPEDPKMPLTMKDAILILMRTAAPETEIVVTSEDKVITIASQAQADQALITRTYFLADVLANVPRFVPGGIDLYKVGPYRPPQPTIEGATPVKPAQSSSINILQLITSTVRPEIWKVNGGKSEIYVVKDRVTVKAPASVHVLLEPPRTHNPNKVNPYITYGQ